MNECDWCLEPVEPDTARKCEGDEAMIPCSVDHPQGEAIFCSTSCFNACHAG